MVRDRLPPRSTGRFIELGSGPGFARELIPEMELSDVVKAPFHDLEVDAQRLPFAAGEIGALVLFDVLHHLPRPGQLFAEATRVLARGGRLILCEPYVSTLSYPIYKFLHEERCDFGVDPFGDRDDASRPEGRDPFDGNQAIPSMLLGPRRVDLQIRFPQLALTDLQRLAGPSYPASGGFSRRALLPMALFRALLAIEDRLPEVAFRLLGFRLLAVFERQ